MGQYKISKAGNMSGGCSGIPDALRAVAQTQARIMLAGKLAVTDNSGGVPDINGRILFPSAIFDSPANGNDRATVATVNAALTAVLNDITTLFVVAVRGANAIGSEAPIVMLGGTDGAGTLAAINTAVAGAAVGPSVVTFGGIMALANTALYELAVTVKKLQVAAGVNELNIAPATAGITYGLGPNFPGVTVAGIKTGSQPGPNEDNIVQGPNSAIDYGLGPNFPGATVNGIKTPNTYPGPFSGTPSPITVAGFTTNAGSTASTGIAATDASAVLALYAANIATIAAGLNATNLPGILGLRATS